jgi:hypothetical protein
MKKTWKKVIELRNYLFVMFSDTADKKDELSKSLEDDASQLEEAQVESISNKIQKLQEKEKQIKVILEAVDPYVENYERLRRHIMRTNAIKIKGGELKKDERGGYCYTEKGEESMDKQLGDLQYKEVEIKDVVDKDSPLLANIDFDILKEFI